MKKTFCIDTNVFIYDPRAVYSFEDNDVVIPIIVLEELDKLKEHRFDDAGKNARITNRVLDELRHTGDLMKGVRLPGGGTLRIIRSTLSADIPQEFDKNRADNFIISAVLELQKELGEPVRLITKDISMRIKCDALGVKCEDYLKHHIGKSDLIYGGVRVVNTTKANLDEFYRSKGLDVDKLNIDEDLFPNEYVVIKNGHSTSGLSKCVDGTLKPIINVDDVWGLKPRNKEQRFALDALFDDNVKLTTMIGAAGCGKTILALAAGIKQVIEEKKFSKLIVSRPIQPMGRDIGYLPGTKEEKMEPWIQPIMDNLEFLFGSRKRDMVQMYFDQGLIEVEAITYIRGRSIPNAYIIIDEGQNLTPHEVKTVITRVGEGTKIVLTGDIEQVDNPQIDALSNGLTYTAEKFKEHAMAAHIALIKGERSALATLAAEIL